MHNTSLQINLSAGDIAYVHLTAPALVNSHRKNVDEVVAVVDCCRPQKTKFVDPEKRFPEPEFGKRVERICTVAEELKAEGYFDRVYYLRPGDPLLLALSRKFFRNFVHATHDSGGIGFMSYLAGLEVCRTQYVIHYDADMLLHQVVGFDWSVEAKKFIEREPDALAATPRVSPPFPTGGGVKDGPSLHEGLPHDPVHGGWRSSWFSTRCFLIDLHKLAGYLPLLDLRLAAEAFARRYLRGVYPLPLEVMLHRRVGSCGGWRLSLDSENAWLIHPSSKPPRYIELLPEILSSVRAGEVPEEQRGYTEVRLPAWENYLGEKVDCASSHSKAGA